MITSSGGLFKDTMQFLTKCLGMDLVLAWMVNEFGCLNVWNTYNTIIHSDSGKDDGNGAPPPCHRGGDVGRVVYYTPVSIGDPILPVHPSYL